MLALYEGARLGLEIGAQLGQYYLIPRGGQVVPMLGYRGMICLALRHPDVKTVTCTAVFKGDTFEHGENMEGQWFEYRSGGNKNPSELEKVFAVCRMANGAVILDVMERSEIEACRARSQAANGPAWRDSYAEMARKTAVRRLFKYMPLVPEVSQALAKDEERWGEVYEEKRDPNKYKSIVRDVAKIQIQETLELEIANDKGRIKEMIDALNSKGKGTETVTGYSAAALLEMSAGPELSAAIEKIERALVDGGAKK